MEKKKSEWFWHLPAVWFVVLTVYTVLRIFYDENFLEAATAYISFWKFAFVALLLTGFLSCRGHRENAGRIGAVLFGILLAEILYSTGLFMYVSRREGKFSLAYTMLVFSRILYAHGIAGSMGLLFGCLCGAFFNNRIAYVLVAAAAVLGADYVDSYRYDLINGNPYNPYSLKGIFRMADGSNMPITEQTEILLGPSSQDYEEAAADVCIERQEIELWINGSRLFEAKVAMNFAPGGSGEKIFRLNSILTVDSVTDAAGNPLLWERKGHYVCVKNAEGVDRITVHYYCDNEEFLAIRGAYVSLPSYVMFYPCGVEEECEYAVLVHAKGKVCSNLPQVGENEFAGRAATFSLLGGKMIAETEIDGVRIVYPAIAATSEKIKTEYRYMLVTLADRHAEGKDCFMDTRIAEDYIRYYHFEELAGEDYLFWWR